MAYVGEHLAIVRWLVLTLIVLVATLYRRISRRFTAVTSISLVSIVSVLLFTPYAIAGVVGTEPSLLDLTLAAVGTIALLFEGVRRVVTKHQGFEGNQQLPSESTANEKTLETTDTSGYLEGDPSAVLRHLAVRSRAATNDALWRAYWQLIIGITLGLGGLIFFFVATYSSVSDGRTPDSWVVVLYPLIRSLPRVGVLVFVEVTAGFFLKQYATAMSDFKYFDGVQRRREHLSVALELHRTDGGKDDLVRFATALAAFEAKDETPKETVAPDNDLLKVVEKTLEVVAGLKPKGKPTLG
jgi:hypothetical protein